jgi:hypothetical protein
MNLVAASRGDPVTVTVNVHASVRAVASRVVQATEDWPRGKAVPLAGLHVVSIGGSPAVTCGGS